MPRIQRIGRFGFLVHLVRPYRDHWFAFTPGEWRWLSVRNAHLNRITRRGPFAYWFINTRFAGSR